MTPIKLLSPLLIALLGLGVTGCLGDGTDQEGSTEQAVVAPANLVATAVSAQEIRLSWDGVAGAAFYVVLKGQGSGTERNLTSTSPPTATTFLDDNDMPNTMYCYQVRVVVGGTASPASAESCATTAGKPPAPSGVQAFATSSTTIDLSWNAVSGATRYSLLESVSGGPFNPIGSVDGSTLSFLVEGLTAGTTYAFEIEAEVPVDLFSDPSTPVTATTFSVGLDAYYRFDDKTGTTAIDATPFRRDGVLQGGAVFDTTDSAPLKDSTDHNPSSASFPTSTSNVSAPGSVLFGGFGDSSISLWVKLTAPPTGPLSIIGRRAARCGEVMWLLGQDTTNGLSFTASSVTSYGTTLPVGTWTQVGAVQHGGTINTYVNGVLVSSSSAFIAGNANSTPLQIGDVGGCGNGGPMLVDEVKIFSVALSAADMATLGTAPPAPTNLTVTETHSTFIKLAWTAVPNADHYLVFKGSAPGNEAFFTSDPVASFVADHLTPNETTSWQVVTISKGGLLLSAMSSELVAAAGPPPPPPTGVTTTLDACCTPARVDLAWNPVPGAVQYSIMQATGDGPFTSVGSTLASVTTLQVAGLASGTTYSFEIITRDDGGAFGPPSAPVSISTP